MKRSQVLAIAVICLLTGALLSHLITRRAEAQSNGVIGRYQLFQGKYYMSSATTSVDMDGVFRVDTITGKTDIFFAGKGSGGKYTEGWSEIP